MIQSRFFSFRLMTFLAVTTVLLSFSSCQDTSQPVTWLAVQVIAGEDSIPVQNAWVRLSAPVGGSIFDDPATSGYYYAKTGPDGWMAKAVYNEDSTRVSYDHRQFKLEGEMYIDIIATKGGWKGCTFKHVRDGGDEYIVVRMWPYNETNNGCP